MRGREERGEAERVAKVEGKQNGKPMGDVDVDGRREIACAENMLPLSATVRGVEENLSASRVCYSR